MADHTEVTFSYENLHSGQKGEHTFYINGLAEIGNMILDESYTAMTEIYGSINIYNVDIKITILEIIYHTGSGTGITIPGKVESKVYQCLTERRASL